MRSILIGKEEDGSISLGKRGQTPYLGILFPEPLEPILQFWPPFPLVGELDDEQAEGLNVAGGRRSQGFRYSFSSL